MKVLVCGSRSWRDTAAIAARFHDLPRDTFVINGGASGADYLAKQEAMRHGFGVMTVYPDWNKHGKRAGVVRNNFMLDQEPDLVLAFWDGESRGTRHTIEEARRRGISVEVIGGDEQEPGEPLAGRH